MSCVRVLSTEGGGMSMEDRAYDTHSHEGKVDGHNGVLSGRDLECS